LQIYTYFQFPPNNLKEKMGKRKKKERKGLEKRRKKKKKKDA